MGHAIFSAIPGLPIAILLMFSGLIVNLIQVICFLFIWPLSKRSFRKIDGVVAQMFYSVFLFSFQWWAGVKVHLFTDSKTLQLLGKEHALVIPNHRHDVDVLVTWVLAQHFGCLGRAPGMMKNSIKFLPTSLQALKNFASPFWLIMFVEGTRLTPKKLLAAQEYSVSAGISVPKNVLVPRTKGFVTTVKYTRLFVQAVYDVTVAVPKNVPPPSCLGICKKQPSVVKVHIKRYSVDELPQSDEAIAKWCRDRFTAKDAFLDIFLASGTYENQQYYDNKPRKPLYIGIFWICSLVASMYKVFQRYSPLSSWKGTGIIGATLALLLMMFYACLLFAQTEKEKAPPKISQNKQRT